MRICYFGTYDQTQSRNLVMQESLSAKGAKLLFCHVNFWGDVQEKIAEVKKGIGNLGLFWRYFKCLPRLLKDYRQAGDYDVMVLGYAGYLDVPLARLLTWIAGKPLAFDVLNSLTEGIIEDRALVSRTSLFGRVIKMADKFICRLPDIIFVDNEVHAGHFQRDLGVNAAKIKNIPAGAEAAFEEEINNHPPDGIFRIIYFGRFLPHHGVDQILAAAKELRDFPDIRFIFVGKGELYRRSVETAGEWKVPNVEFHHVWLPPEEFNRRYLCHADICLGNFGQSTHAMRVVPHKVFAAMAAGKAVITGDGPAARLLFGGDDGVVLCPRGRPTAMAELILQLKNDPQRRQSLGEKAKKTFDARFSYPVLGGEILAALKS